MNKLNNYYRISNIVLGRGINLRETGYKIQDSAQPINQFFWIRNKDHYGIPTVSDWKYLEYEDAINNKLWPFKKES